MLKIEKDEKNIFPFKELASMELFYRENDTDVYYSYFDSNGMFTAVNLTTGEEAEDLLTTEIVTRIQGNFRVGCKSLPFLFDLLGGSPSKGETRNLPPPSHMAIFSGESQPRICAFSFPKFCFARPDPGPHMGPV